MYYSPTTPPPLPSSPPRYYTPTSPHYSPNNSPRYAPSSPFDPATTTVSSSSSICYSPTQPSIHQQQSHQDNTELFYSPPIPHSPIISKVRNNTVTAPYQQRRGSGGRQQQAHSQPQRPYQYSERDRNRFTPYVRGGGRSTNNNNNNQYRNNNNNNYQPRRELPATQQQQRPMNRSIRDCLIEKDFYYERQIQINSKYFTSEFVSEWKQNNTVELSSSSSSLSSSLSSAIVQTSITLIGQSSNSGTRCLIPMYDIRYDNDYTNQTKLQLVRPQLLYDICLIAPPSNSSSSSTNRKSSHRTVCAKLVQLLHSESGGGAGGSDRNSMIGAKLLFDGTMEDLQTRFTRDNPLPLFSASRPPEIVLMMDVDAHDIPGYTLSFVIATLFTQAKIDLWKKQNFIIQHTDFMNPFEPITLQ